MTVRRNFAPARLLVLGESLGWMLDERYSVDWTVRTSLCPTRCLDLMRMVVESQVTDVRMQVTSES